MASTGSKGNRKRISTLQKAHYQAYRLVDKGKINLIKRLKTRIRRNEAEIKRKGLRSPLRAINVDIGAIDRLKELGL